MGRTSKKSTLAEKVVEAGGQALPRIEAARDAVVAELAPQVAGAGRKARKQLAATTARASASVDAARQALAPAPKPRRGKKLALVLAIAGIGALAFKNLRQRTTGTTASYQPPVTTPPVTQPSVTQPSVTPPPPAAPVVVDTDEEPAAPDDETAEAPAETPTTFFDEVMTEAKAAKKDKR